MPVGAFGGRREVMDVIAPLGGVYQAGTLSGNPIAMQAGLATLELIDHDGFYADLATKTTQLVDGISAIAEEVGIALSTNQVGSMFGLFFTDVDRVTSFKQVMNADTDMFNQFFQGMLAEGVNLAPSPFESGFVSAAHGEAEIAATLEAAEITFRKMRS